MIDILQDYVWEADKNELMELVDLGCEIIYQDVSLTVIYDELVTCFDNNELQQQIKEHFGFYGLSALLHVDGMYYWIMQV